MTTIHIIETEEERATVKRIFRKRVNELVNCVDDIYNNIDGNMCTHEDGSCDMMFGDGAIVYDIIGDGDPELGWMVYDFRGHATCYSVQEWDTAGLMSLPGHVFPF